MTTHLVKCWPQYFDAIKSGQKTFDLRRDDRRYEVGDLLVIKKYDAARQDYVLNEKCQIEQIERRITYILRDFIGLEYGYVVLGLQQENQNESSAPPSSQKDQVT